MSATKWPCPCCGYNTLDELGAYEICTVCWWEDDGQDNQDVDEVRRGPNGSLSLTKARINFLRYGTSRLGKNNLKPDRLSMYTRGRCFALDITGHLKETTGV